MITEREKTPNCPYCGHGEAYEITTRQTLRCTKCLRHFSIKSASAYRGAKVSLKTIKSIERDISKNPKINVAAIARKHKLSYRGAYYLVKRIVRNMKANP